MQLLLGEPERGNPWDAGAQAAIRASAIAQHEAASLPGAGQLVGDELQPEHGWRYYDSVVGSQAKIEEKIRYLHGNPVKRGLVRQQWRWSSARDYILGEAAPVRLNERQTVELKWSDPKSKPTPEPVWEAEPEFHPPKSAEGGATMVGSRDDKRWASPLRPFLS